MQTAATLRKIYRKAIRAIALEPIRAFAYITILLSRTSFLPKVQGADNQLDSIGLALGNADLGDRYSNPHLIPETIYLRLKDAAYANSVIHNAFINDDVDALRNFVQQNADIEDLYHSLWWKAVSSRRSKIFHYIISQPTIRHTIIYQDAYELALDENVQLLEALNSVGLTAHDKFLFKILDELESYRAASRKNLSRIKQLIIAFDLLIKNGGNRYAMREGQSLMAKALTSTNTRVIQTLLDQPYDFNHHPGDVQVYLDLINRNDFQRFELLLKGQFNLKKSHLKNNLPIFLTAIIAKYQQPSDDYSYEFLQNLSVSPHAKIFLQDLRDYFPGPVDYLDSFANPNWRPYYRVMIPIGTFVHHNLSIIVMTFLASVYALYKQPKRLKKALDSLFKKKSLIIQETNDSNEDVKEKHSITKHKKHAGRKFKNIKKSQRRNSVNSITSMLASEESDSDMNAIEEDELDIEFILKNQQTHPCKTKNDKKVKSSHLHSALVTNTTLQQQCLTQSVTQKTEKMKVLDSVIAKSAVLTASNKDTKIVPRLKSLQAIVSSEKTFAEALTLTPRCVAKITIPEEATRILNLLSSANSPQAHLSFVVGGLIRDSLLEVDISCADIDIVTGIQANVLIALFKDREMTILESGNYLQVVEGVRKIDIWCSKELANPYYKNVKDALRADCKSRDFIINGLYANKDGHVFDPSNKALDNVLQGRVIDTVIDADISIQEDPIRILRAVYYSEKLNRPLSSNLQNAICKYQHLLLKDKPEYYFKLNANLSKLLLGKNSYQIFYHLASHRLLETLFSTHVSKVIQNDISIAALLKQAHVGKWRIARLLLNFILMSIPAMDNAGVLKTYVQNKPDSFDKLEAINQQLLSIKTEALEYASHGCIAQCLGSRFDKVLSETLNHFETTRYLINEKERLDAMDFVARQCSLKM